MWLIRFWLDNESCIRQLKIVHVWASLTKSNRQRWPSGLGYSMWFCLNVIILVKVNMPRITESVVLQFFTIYFITYTRTNVPITCCDVFCTVSNATVPLNIKKQWKLVSLYSYEKENASSVSSESQLTWRDVLSLSCHNATVLFVICLLFRIM